MKEISSTHKWIITLVGGLFFFYNFMQMTLFNPLGPAIMEYFKIDSIAFGSINAGYFLAVGLLAVPAGMIADKFRTKTLLLILMLGTILNIVLTSSIHDPNVLGMLRFVQGLIHAFALTLPMKLALQWIAPNRMAVASSLIVTLGLLGGASQSFTTYILESQGLHQTFLADAYLGVGIFLLFAVVVRDNEAFWERHHTQAWSEYFAGLRVSLFNGQNWIGGVYVLLLNLPLILLGAIWGQLYMEHTWALKPEVGSFIISLLFIGGIIGGPLVGILSDAMRSRKKPMVAGSILSLIVLGFILISSGLPMLLLATLFFLLGVTTCSQVLVYPMITESNPPRYMGTSLSIVTLVIMIGNAFASVVFSGLISQNTVHTAWGPEYSAQSFSSSLWLMWAAIVISLLLIYMMRETFKTDH